MCKKLSKKVRFNKKLLSDLIAPTTGNKAFIYDIVERGLGLWDTKTGIKTIFCNLQ